MHNMKFTIKFKANRQALFLAMGKNGIKNNQALAIKAGVDGVTISRMLNVYVSLETALKVLGVLKGASFDEIFFTID